jgi:FkbH-like protein
MDPRATIQSPQHSSGIWELPKELKFPISTDTILRKRAFLRRELLKQKDLLPCRIAILGGSTTQEIRSILELFLLAQGIQPLFYESAYNAFYEEVIFENQALWAFRPEIVFVHTTWHNVSTFPEPLNTDEQVESAVHQESARFEAFWNKIHSDLGAVIIQNNFDLPRLRPLGNLESFEQYSRVHFLLRLNSEIAKYARSHSRFAINDILYLSAQIGLDQWFDYSYWYNYHMALSPTATVALSQNVASIVKSIYGRSKKCLVLDLDNTLWGGVIGDDGVQNIVLGRDHPLGEAYLAFQRYVKELRKRGILLAVCSKNDEANAKEGFSHPDSLLTVEDFSAFKANWNPKSDNIREIAAELNIGLESLVFVDDNPAERAIVSAQVPEVAVPEVGADVSMFAEVLEREGYFEPFRLVRDDVQRASYYGGNAQRKAYEATFKNYGEFLDSLEMYAEIEAFTPIYFDRITQLINKSNQFNLTTRRYTAAEVEAVASSPEYVTLYGRMRDRFGDNGLVSIIIGSVRGETLEINLWVMSCRVLKREMEFAMFDRLIEECGARGIHTIMGVYIPSKKNGMVAEHYSTMGFEPAKQVFADRSVWFFEIPRDYRKKAQHMRYVSAINAVLNLSSNGSISAKVSASE